MSEKFEGMEGKFRPKPDECYMMPAHFGGYKIDGKLLKPNCEQKVPAGAYPADKAACDILDRVAERKGIIIVPEELNTDLWREYVLGDKEEFLLNLAHKRRAALEKGVSYF